VGDVHGCVRQLDRLLREIRFDDGRDELWSVGDLVCTGPESAAALRLWRDVGGRGVLGNHDIFALRVRSGDRERKSDDGLEGLFGTPDAEELFGALGRLPVMAHLPGDRHVSEAWIIHAGLHPRWTDLHETAARLNEGERDDAWLTRDEVDFATRVRCCGPDGELLDDPGPPSVCDGPYRPWDQYYSGDALIIHGHWARRGFYRGAHTMGLDSGCVYGGYLTAWCQEEDGLARVR
jgi:bis(5'-nucleosyl)-tetraphosphatase (symmetrical)